MSHGGPVAYPKKLLSLNSCIAPPLLCRYQAVKCKHHNLIKGKHHNVSLKAIEPKSASGKQRKLLDCSERQVRMVPKLAGLWPNSRRCGGLPRVQRLALAWHGRPANPREIAPLPPSHHAICLSSQYGKRPVWSQRAGDHSHGGRWFTAGANGLPDLAKQVLRPQGTGQRREREGGFARPASATPRMQRS